jgi:hypothetical protein
MEDPMQAPAITTALAGIRTEDRVAEAAARRARWTPIVASEVTIRLARPRDAGALDRLAELDGRHERVTGDVLVAEADGVLLAARSVRGGMMLSDPFRASAELADLLDVRARQLAGRRSRRRRLRGPRQSMPSLRVGGAR